MCPGQPIKSKMNPKPLLTAVLLRCINHECLLLVLSLADGLVGIAELGHTQTAEFGTCETSLCLIASNGCGSFSL